MNANRKTVIAVVGPTAVGKTAAALELAAYFHTEILSADSRQCYQELNIGVARPSPSELQRVKHHFIASHSIMQDLTASDYEHFALQVTDGLWDTQDQILLVGGTGLYIRAFLNGLDSIPPIDPKIRQEIQSHYEQEGLSTLADRLGKLDPRFLQEGEMQNPHRVMRALEVVMSTGESILSFRTGQVKDRPFEVKWVGLELPRNELVERIDRRVDSMMEAGLLEEARGLLPQRDLNALQTVGYKELFDHLQGKTSLSEAVDLIKTATRQYAKRQMTWFRKIPNISWFHPQDISGMLRHLRSVQG